MVQIKSGEDFVQLAYAKKKQGFDAPEVVIMVEGKTVKIGFGKKTRMNFKRKMAMTYVGKSRQWGHSHLDTSPVLSIVEIDDDVDLEDDEPTEGSEKVADIDSLGYNELVKLAKDKGLDVIGGGPNATKKDEIVAMLKAL